MSDQLSKVGKPAPNWCPRCNKRPDDVTFCTHEFHRIESAAAPVEVEEVPEMFPGTLASLERVGVKRFYCDSTVMGTPVMLEDPEAGFVRYDDYATLARQLAESEEDRATARRAAIANEQEAERMGVLIAAATRRVAEVEGLVGRWRDEAAGQSGYWVDALRNCAAELESALRSRNEQIHRAG